jgi:Uma2 family endonuclease
LIEVLSDSTEAYDRGEKREHYLTIESLSEYMLVSQRERKVELWRRDGAAWEMSRAGPSDTLSLHSIGLELDVGALYRQALD